MCVCWSSVVVVVVVAHHIPAGQSGPQAVARTTSQDKSLLSQSQLPPHPGVPANLSLSLSLFGKLI